MALLRVLKHLRGLREPPGHVNRYLKMEANPASETTCLKKKFKQIFCLLCCRLGQMVNLAINLVTKWTWKMNKRRRTVEHERRGDSDVVSIAIIYIFYPQGWYRGKKSYHLHCHHTERPNLPKVCRPTTCNTILSKETDINIHTTPMFLCEVRIKRSSII